MAKMIIIAVLIVLAVAALWFWRLPGPHQLDLADRLYPMGDKFTGSVAKGIEYDAETHQKLDIFKPAEKNSNPVLIFFHGGSWRDGTRDGYGFVGRAFAARGFTTIIADYRKVPQVQFPAFVQDAAAAIHWTHANIAKHGGDPKRIFAMGHSAGAHIAMLATLDPRWLEEQGADPAIISGVVGISGPYNFLPFEEGGAAQAAMGNWQQPEETQPISYVRDDGPSLLLLTGDSDKTVKPRNSISMHDAVVSVGAPSALKLYAGLDHTDPLMAIATPFRDRALVIEDTIAFLRSADTKKVAK